MARALSFVRFNSCQIERYTDEPKVSFGLHWKWVATNLYQNKTNFVEFPREIHALDTNEISIETFSTRTP
jgi:hypothetical protein